MMQQRRARGARSGIILDAESSSVLAGAANKPSILLYRSEISG